MGIGHPYFNNEVGRVMNQLDQQLGQALGMQNMQMGAGGVQNMQGSGSYQQYNTTACFSAYTDAFIPAHQQLRAVHPGSATQPKKETSMFKEVIADIKSFLLEHRGIIYFIVIALALDHFFFRGAFKARLQAMADRVVTKVEEKIQ